MHYNSYWKRLLSLATSEYEKKKKIRGSINSGSNIINSGFNKFEMIVKIPNKQQEIQDSGMRSKEMHQSGFLVTPKNIILT